LLLSFFSFIHQTGKEPHEDMTMLRCAIAIIDGLTLKIPSNAPPVLKALMKSCWNMKPDRRPTFQQICRDLRKKVLEEGGSESEQSENKSEELIVRTKSRAKKKSVKQTPRYTNVPTGSKRKEKETGSSTETDSDASDLDASE